MAVHAKSGHILIGLKNRVYIIRYESRCRKIERLSDALVPNAANVSCLKFLDKWVPPKQPTEPDAEYFVAAVNDKPLTVYTFKDKQLVRTFKVYPPGPTSQQQLNLGGIIASSQDKQERNDKVITLHDFVWTHSKCTIMQAYFIVVVTELGLCGFYCLSIQEALVHRTELFESAVGRTPLGFESECSKYGLQAKALDIKEKEIAWSRVQQAVIDSQTRYLAISVLTKMK